MAGQAQGTTVRALQGDSVDALCWRHYGRTQGMPEAVFEANPGLASHGPVLPQGLAVFLPDRPAPTQRPTVQLWD